MPMPSRSRMRLVCLGALCGLLTACGDPQPPADTLLSRVPADTPYVFANLHPVPEPLVDRMLAMQDELLGRYRDALGRQPAAAAGSAAARALQLADALLAELEGNLNRAGYARLGLRLDARAVLYGDGLLPVLRVELADGQQVSALLDRVERRAQLAAPRGRFGDVEYRRIELSGLNLLLGVQGNELLGALVPAAREVESLPRLFGAERPGASLAHSGAFGQLLQDYGLPGYGDGFVDWQRLAGQLRQSGVAAGTSLASVDAACTALADALLAGMPRLVMGTVEASAVRYRVRVVAETSPAVAQVLAGLAYPVPGLGQPTDALFAMGLGVDVPRLRGGLRDLLQQIARSGRGCPLVDAAAIEQAIPKLDLVLGPMTAMFKGLYLELLDIDLDAATGQPVDLQARVLAEVDDPRGVFAIAGLANPALAQLEVPEDGTPTLVPAPLLPPQAPPLQVAIRGRSLVLGSGGEAEALARGLLAAAPVTPAPLFALSYNLARLGKLLPLASAPLASAAQAQGQSAEQVLADLQAMLRLYQGYGVVALRLSADPKGLVLEQSVEFR